MMSPPHQLSGHLGYTLNVRFGSLTVRSKSHLVQSDQLAPRAFGFGPAVDRRAVFSRHIRHAPTVPGWIDFDFRRNLRRGKRFSELVFRVELALVVVRCDSEVHPRLDLRRKQMRAVRLMRHQTAPMECGSG